MAHVVMAHTVMAHTVMAHTVKARTVMASGSELSDGFMYSKRCQFHLHSEVPGVHSEVLGPHKRCLVIDTRYSVTDRRCLCTDRRCLVIERRNLPIDRRYLVIDRRYSAIFMYSKHCLFHVHTEVLGVHTGECGPLPSSSVSEPCVCRHACRRVGRHAGKRA